MKKTEFAKSLAVHAGKIKEVRNGGKPSPAESNYRGIYKRLRIELDTTKPILPRLFLGRINRKPIWIYVKYEKLPNVCYRCGMLNHETRQCKTPPSNKEKVYGGWLKAEDQSTFIPEWSEELSNTYHLVVSPAEVLPLQVANQGKGEVKGKDCHVALDLEQSSMFTKNGEERSNCDSTATEGEGNILFQFKTCVGNKCIILGST